MFFRDPAQCRSDAALRIAIGQRLSLYDFYACHRVTSPDWRLRPQVNFLFPPPPIVPATVTIASQSGAFTVALSSAINITPVAPAMFTLNGSGLAAAYAVLVSSDGTQTVEQVYSAQTGAVAAPPVNLGASTNQVYLALYGTGIRNAASGSVHREHSVLERARHLRRTSTRLSGSRSSQRACAACPCRQRFSECRADGEPDRR
jgi:hypothetical protein